MTTYLQTLTHFVKGVIGAGIFSMGIAFKNGGLMFATIFTIVMGLLVLHCATLVVRIIEYQEWQKEGSKKQITKLNRTYADIAEEVFEDGPPLAKTLAKYIKRTINILMCFMNLGFCCVYIVFIGNNMQKALKFFEIEVSMSVVMLIFIIPMWLSSLITNLKWLAPVSTVANAILFTAIGITLYYISVDLRDFKSFSFIASINTLPLFMAVALYTFDCMSLVSHNFGPKLGKCINCLYLLVKVLPLRNEMDNPKRLVGLFGVMNMGFLIVTPIVVSLGFLAYLKYGDEIQGTIFLNLPENDIFVTVCVCIISYVILINLNEIYSRLVQVLLILVCAQVMFTYAVQLYVPVTIMWPMVVDKYGPFKYELLFLLTFRTALVILTLAIAEAIPFIDLIISLIGAICSSCLTLLLPPILDIIISQHKNKNKKEKSLRKKFVLIKNVLISTLAIVIFFTGVFTSVRNIINSL
ncbi:amino acid transporter [Holotrichia oblita]|uniref:Amino acid transporter n=1 Tax=Holotrichia oblita TaxID=644536 RepID=A0ACB9TY60_HOLOL|nr:amino acid transporter [Holotrichia oblita]